MDTWSRITTIRTELIDELATLPPESWNARTLCTGWRVRDVVAHTFLPERVSFACVVVGLARSGFSLSRFIHEEAIRRGSIPVPDLVAAFRSAIPRRTVPPMRTAENVLADLVIHAQDIRRPLGLAWSYEPEMLAGVAGTVLTDRALGVPRRVAGLRLQATDLEWSAGAGPEVAGTLEALVLAMSGRSAVLGELSGRGRDELAARLP